jgi:hypothetical protein
MFDYILMMTPAKLRKELTHSCAIDPSLAGKIEAEVKFEPRWSKMSTMQYALVAAAWARINERETKNV